jgi:hypothetical protein
MSIFQAGKSEKWTVRLFHLLMPLCLYNLSLRHPKSLIPGDTHSMWKAVGVSRMWHQRHTTGENCLSCLSTFFNTIWTQSSLHLGCEGLLRGFKPDGKYSLWILNRTLAILPKILLWFYSVPWGKYKGSTSIGPRPLHLRSLPVCYSSNIWYYII